MSLPAVLGTEIRDYRLDSVLGQGGMGCVYAATHMRLGRQVALKMLAPELAASEEYVSRFESEARIVNEVRHPNIVDIHDFFHVGEHVAYVMEFVEGVSLGQFLREGPLTVRQAVNVTFQLASALEAVHQVGVVHRDLKPDNVLVLGARSTDMGELPSVKILDFGIAKTTGEDVSHKTMTGSMLGTPTYMAPEQVAAEPVSPATDIYALAEILYEMVAGQRIFRGDRMEILRDKLTGNLPDLAWPDVPGWQTLDALVRGGLAARPEKRITIGELVVGLNEVIAAQPDSPANTPLPGTYVPPPALTQQNLDAQTPVNMQSVVALAPPRPMPQAKLLMGGGVLLAAALAIGTFAYRDAHVVDAAPLQATAVKPAPVSPSAPLDAKPPTPAPDVVPAAAPTPTETAEAAPAVEDEPVVEPAAPPPKKAPVRRRRRRRAAKPAPRPTTTTAPAPAPKPRPTVVRKSEIPSW